MLKYAIPVEFTRNGNESIGAYLALNATWNAAGRGIGTRRKKIVNKLFPIVGARKSFHFIPFTKEQPLFGIHQHF